MKCKSLKGKTCAQVYTYGKGFIQADPMISKKELVDTLGQFLEDIGIPRKIYMTELLNKLEKRRQNSKILCGKIR